MSVGSIVILLLAVALLVTAVLLVRSSNAVPWPAIVVAALTSAVCYTVGGDSSADTSGPSIATVMGSVAGVLSVVAAILALVPRRPAHDGAPGPRIPILVSATGVALGALGLLLTLLTG